MLPLYTSLDLLINYGLGNLLFRLFKSNSIILVFISMITGSPGNAKYIKEFYLGGYISLDMANFLLTFAYSPNPLFVLASSPSVLIGFKILGIIYFTNFINFIIFRRIFKNLSSSFREFKRESFSKCLEASIDRSFNVLVLILGIVVVYGILNTILCKFGIESVLLSSILEMTNALKLINTHGYGILWLSFACIFSGLSIHTQIKSILENTDISYKYFLFGRLLASSLILAGILFY